jgi:hypothetical protein
MSKLQCTRKSCFVKGLPIKCYSCPAIDAIPLPNVLYEHLMLLLCTWV